MMLPNRPKTDAPSPVDTAAPTPPATPAGKATVPPAPHTDYNLRPLPVPPLDHYVEREEDERFRVVD